MRDALGIWKREHWLAVLAAGLLALGAACGDDDGGGDDDEGDDSDAERCSPAGRTETGCICASDRPPGHRQCISGIWSACTCPPARAENECDFEGQRVDCWPCPGETQGRVTQCGEDGTFDCSCRIDGGTANDAGGGNDGG